MRPPGSWRNAGVALFRPTVGAVFAGRKRAQPAFRQALAHQRTHSLPAIAPSLGGSISGIKEGASAVSSCTGNALVKS